MYKPLVCLLFLVSSLANAAGYVDTNAAQKQLNNASPEGMRKYQLGTMIVKQQEHSIKCRYDYAVVGGATTGLLNLKDESGKNCVLPKNAIVLHVLIDVLTAPTSGGSAQISFGTSASFTAFKAATAIASYTGLVAGTQVDTAATAIKLSQDFVPAASVTVAPLTAGKMNVHIRYKLSE